MESLLIPHWVKKKQGCFIVTQKYKTSKITKGTQMCAKEMAFYKDTANFNICRKDDWVTILWVHARKCKGHQISHLHRI